MPNFTTFDHGVLWAAIDFLGKIIGKRTKQKGCLAASLLEMASKSRTEWENLYHMYFYFTLRLFDRDNAQYIIEPDYSHKANLHLLSLMTM